MGEAAALLTACCWVVSSLAYSASVQVVGAPVVNRVRLVMAVAFLMVTHRLLMGTWIPAAEGVRWLWLGLSGLAGLVLGDWALLSAYGLVGPRIATLMMAVSPVISTFLAWAFLGERLQGWEYLGVVLALAGVGLVVFERTDGLGRKVAPRRYFLGVLAGLGAAAGQSSGLILAKAGLAGGFSPLSGVLMRMLAAGAILWLATFLGGRVRSTLTILNQNRPVLGRIALGSVMGPFVGVWLSLVAVQASHVGVASTLMAMTPVLILPVVRWGLKEQVSRRAVLGTLVSIVGVAVIFVVG